MSKSNTDELEIVGETFAIKATVDSSILGNQYYEAFKGIKENLKTLDVNRGGGLKQTSGFVFENMDALQQNIDSIKQRTNDVFYVIDDNGIADIQRVSQNGEVTYLQAKKGYHGTNKYKVKKDYYSDMEKIIIDKNNDELYDYLTGQGMKVQRSSITDKQSDNFTQLMRNEANLKEKLGLNKNPTISSNLYTMGKKLEASLHMSIKVGADAAAFTAGMSLGKNTYFLMHGDIDFKEYACECAKETVCSGFKSFSASYLSSLAMPIIATQMSRIAIMKSASGLLIKVGAISAKCSIACGPLFLIGMAAGCAITGVTIAKTIMDQNKKSITQINSFLNDTIKVLQACNEELNKLVDEKNEYYVNEINRGLSEILISSIHNDYEKINDGLSRIIKLYNQELLFSNINDFDRVFFGNEKIKF